MRSSCFLVSDKTPKNPIFTSSDLCVCVFPGKSGLFWEQISFLDKKFATSPWLSREDSSTLTCDCLLHIYKGLTAAKTPVGLWAAVLKPSGMASEPSQSCFFLEPEVTVFGRDGRVGKGTNWI